MFLTLEQEFNARAMHHKLIMVGTYLSNQYIADNSTLKDGSIDIPNQNLHEQSLEYATYKTQEYLLEGKLEQIYTDAWNDLQYKIPDNYVSSN